MTHEDITDEDVVNFYKSLVELGIRVIARDGEDITELIKQME